jgi:putative FmdB family regulatory protein
MSGMPIYEYSCPECGVFECRQKYTDEALKTCPTCGKEVKKLIGRNIGVIYRTGGYYVSDHRSEDYRKKAGEDKTNSSVPASKPAAE